MNSTLYMSFMNDVKSDLAKGEKIIAFFDYQLEELKKEYKSNLEYEYVSNRNWYVCKLKNPFKGTKHSLKYRTDLDIKKIHDLYYKKGISAYKISQIMKCSYSAIKNRLGDKYYD